jgi:hypothetical protein
MGHGGVFNLCCARILWACGRYSLVARDELRNEFSATARLNGRESRDDGPGAGSNTRSA